MAGSVDTLEVRVNDGTLWSNWTSFTVTPTALIQTDGATSLVQSGANFFLNPDRAALDRSCTTAARR